MIEQYLSNTNEKATVSILQNILEGHNRRALWGGINRCRCCFLQAPVSVQQYPFLTCVKWAFNCSAVRTAVLLQCSSLTRVVAGGNPASGGRARRE